LFWRAERRFGLFRTRSSRLITFTTFFSDIAYFNVAACSRPLLS
jgi:hypothetical protein